MGNCLDHFKRTKKVTESGIIYYNLPEYNNKNIQTVFDLVNKKYPQFKVVSVKEEETLEGKNTNKIIYIFYDVDTQEVKNVSYFP
ncbi:hypothetical protein QKU48_gp0090 [Fadolivirus algeromassiliense]|jgi:hypothetical protein|uniref:Uncharacterized protein n=1 Tax=Fadolivirus FV1/VV64 TaxID=3070911 RepID=A0A7D3UNS2_9VIRU|nr:hypothetical protein QKU48_gp0090 [Fadolivirus algeromassiliense]QKF93548.1 hypothetical protein Fadolivirus_1_90 [Fadolivirus FV1/VV64]